MKGFNTNQEDFNVFCNKLSLFKSLKSLKIRFYNKMIQNLDNLFINIREISKVELNFKNFKKMIITNAIISSSKIDKLKLNLKNFTFKNESS